MSVRNGRESGKRVRRGTSALATGTPETAPAQRPTIAANTASNTEELLVQRFMMRSAAIVREILREQREALMRAAPPLRGARHVATREDIDAAEQVDELTRARARQIISRVTSRRGGRR